MVLVGGGHAHLTSLKNLSRFTKMGHQVTLISTSPYHYYSGMGPGMLSGMYQPWEVRFNIKKLAEDRGATFIEGKATRIDPDHHLIFLESKERICYDVVSFNIGSDISTELVTKASKDNLFPVKPVVNLLKARHTILKALQNEKALRLIVIGGGPAGVEISANLFRLLDKNRSKGEITLIGGKKLLGEAPDRVRHLSIESLKRRGVTIIEGSYVKKIEDDNVILDTGKRLEMDFAFLATGIKPPSLFRNSHIPTGEDGGLLVNAHLQSVAHPDIFGGGDCISLKDQPLAKVGVYAVRESAILYQNLMATLTKGKMQIFSPQKHYLLIFNMGDGKGIYWRKNCIWEGRLAFLLKNHIDRKFMRTFQISGELNEKSDRVEGG